jgi:hypothetical protein
VQDGAGRGRPLLETGIEDGPVGGLDGLEQIVAISVGVPSHARSSSMNSFLNWYNKPIAHTVH